jgi:hypothetical protein
MSETPSPEGLSPEVMQVLMDNTRVFIESGLAGKYHAAIAAMVDTAGPAVEEARDQEDESLKDLIGAMQQDDIEAVGADLPLGVLKRDMQASELFERPAGTSYNLVKIDIHTGNIYGSSSVNIGHITTEGQYEINDAIAGATEADLDLLAERAAKQEEVGFNPTFGRPERPDADS